MDRTHMDPSENSKPRGTVTDPVWSPYGTPDPEAPVNKLQAQVYLGVPGPPGILVGRARQ